MSDTDITGFFMTSERRAEFAWPDDNRDLTSSLCEMLADMEKEDART